MPKVTSKKSISFPKLNWGINTGETRELPDEKYAQERILSEVCITPISEEKKEIISKSVTDNKQK